MSIIDDNNEPPLEYEDERDTTLQVESTAKTEHPVIDAEIVGEASPAPGRELTKAAALVPVSQHGAAPINLANQITIAQYMAKAQLMVPDHFHGNVGDCLAIIDISQRAGLSPYQVAAKTYKNPNGKGLAYESQLYHAFLISSGRMKDAALNVKYEGTGGDRKCTVWATLVGEDEPRYYTSPPLKELHPGYTHSRREGSTTTKKTLTYLEGQRLRNSEGFEGTLYTTGSPLWDAKPDVQHFYDTSRDWGRMFCPIATLGMMAQYETIERPLSPPAEIASDAEGLQQRLAASNKDEGHKPGAAASELSKVASETVTTIKPAEGEKSEPDKPAADTGKKAAGKKGGKNKRTVADAKAKEPDPAAEKIAENAKAREEKNGKQETDGKPKAPEPIPTDPKTASEYIAYATDWINKAADPEQVIKRWESEYKLRRACNVPLKTSTELRDLINRKHGV